MCGFALYSLRGEGPRMQSLVHGLMLAAVAVVAPVVFQMRLAFVKKTKRLRDFCGICCASLCSVVPNAMGATRIGRLKSIGYNSLPIYEPRGWE